MIIGCPTCSTKYRITADKLSANSIKLRCQKCGTIFLLKRRIPLAVESPELPAVLKGKKILIAHSSDSMKEMMGKLLKEGGFVPLFAKNGVEAVSVMTDMHPEVAIVDVALPDIFGFEFPDIIKKDKRLSGIKVILIASIYDKTRYKRMPQNLYGANDFIEKHHIRDSLIPKINSVMSDQKEVKKAPKQKEAVQIGIGVNETTTAKVAKDDAEKLREEEVLQTSVDNRDIEKAKRLARSIISDIALYNQELLEQGIRQGTVEEIMKNDLEEGRRFFNKRISEYAKAKGDFFRESLNELIEKKKKELGLV